MFSFINPIGLDAWASKDSVFVGDAHYNRIFEVTDDSVDFIAGTGEKGNRDGDGLSEASFDSIRSISVLSNYIAVLSNNTVRFIHRATNKVTSLVAPPPWDPKLHRHLQLGSASQCVEHTIEVANVTLHDIQSWTIATPDSPRRFRHNAGELAQIFLDSPARIIGLATDQKKATIVTHFHHARSSCDFPTHLCGPILPVYCPAIDSLIAVHRGSLHIFEGFLGMEDEPLHTATFDFPNTDGLSAFHRLPTDFEILHTASNTSISVHQSILDQSGMINVEVESSSNQLSTFIRSSALPIDVILHYIDYRYFKPLPNDCSLLIAFTWISKTVFGLEDPIVLKALQDQISALSNSELCELLISTWMNKTGTLEFEDSSPIIAILVARVQKCSSAFKVAFDLLMTSPNTFNLAKLVSRMSSLLMMVSGAPQSLTLPAITKPASFFFYPISALKSKSDFFKIYSTNYIITIRSRRSFDVCGWLLYVHWPWFKSLIDSGLEESKTRIITLPQDSFTPRAMEAALIMLQLGHMDSVELLTTKDILSILEHAAAFSLIDLDGKVLPRAEPLIKECEARVFLPLTEANCWEQLRMAHALHSSKYDEILDSLPTVATKIDFGLLTSLPEEISHDLVRMLKRKSMPE